MWSVGALICTARNHWSPGGREDGPLKRLPLAPNSVAIAVEIMGIGREDGKVLLRNVRAIQVGGWRRDAEIRIGR